MIKLQINLLIKTSRIRTYISSLEFYTFKLLLVTFNVTFLWLVSYHLITVLKRRIGYAPIVFLLIKRKLYRLPINSIERFSEVGGNVPIIMTVVFFGKNGGNGLVSIVSATEHQLLSQSSMDSTFNTIYELCHIFKFNYLLCKTLAILTKRYSNDYKINHY